MLGERNAMYICMGSVVRYYRKRLGVRQPTLASVLDVGQPQVSLLETGKRPWSIWQLCCAADLLNLTPGYLLNRTHRLYLDTKGAKTEAELLTRCRKMLEEE